MVATRILRVALISLLFVALTYYIGWSAATFLQAYEIESNWILWTVVSLLSLSYFGVSGLIRLWDGLPVRIIKDCGFLLRRCIGVSCPPASP